MANTYEVLYVVTETVQQFSAEILWYLILGTYHILRSLPLTA
jgi:hypothetical protein